MAQSTSNVQRITLHVAIKLAFSNLEQRLRGITDLSTPYLSGAPGGGKTQSMRAEAYKRNMHFVSRNLGMARAEEFGGIPEISKKGDELHTTWTIPELLCEIRTKAKEKDVICLLDDWHLSSSQIQAMGYEMFSDYTLKGYKIPKNVLIVLAGNDTAAAGARSQFSAVMNRVSKFYVETDFEYWKHVYAYPNNISDPILSFLDTKENRPFFHGKEDVVNPWPSPRSYTNLSYMLKGLSENGLMETLSDYEELCLYSSHIGIEAAVAFQTFHKIYRSFNTDAIFNTGKYKIPNDPINRYAFTSAISSGFYNRYDGNNKKDKNVFVKILDDLHINYPELAINSIRYMAAKDLQIIKELTTSGKIKPALLQDLLKTSQLLSSGRQ